MTAFAADLAAARASVVHDVGDAVVLVVGDAFGLTTDPRDEAGAKGPWHYADQGRAIRTVVRVLVIGFGWTQAAAAERVAKPSEASYVRRPEWLDDDELEVFGAADDLVGRAP